MIYGVTEYAAVPLNRVLIRELRSDMLPGKSFWTPFHSTAAPQTDAANKFDSSMVLLIDYHGWV